MTDAQELTLIVDLRPGSVDALCEAVLITEDTREIVVNEALQMYARAVSTAPGGRFSFDYGDGVRVFRVLNVKRQGLDWMLLTVLSGAVLLVAGLAFFAGMAVR